MENGESNLESKLVGLTVTDPYHINGSDRLLQVEKAVDAAQATIKQQLVENNRLRIELQRKNDEIEKYRSGYLNYQSPQSEGRRGGHDNEPRRDGQIVLHQGNQTSEDGKVEINSGHLLGSAYQTDVIRSKGSHGMQCPMENQIDSGSANGSLNAIHGSEVATDQTELSPHSGSPSVTLSTPARFNQEVNLEAELRYPGMMPNSMEVNDAGSVKQDIFMKIREHEKEILQLKKHLTEFSIKEAQICDEKYALERRISHMRIAFDQQQQDLVLAASKAISYRQDIMEENVRLTYALQAAQHERSTFITSLMPLLVEYSLQLPVVDAQSIVSNVKVLFRHLQEQLLATQGKLEESQYQLAPWRSEVNLPNYLQLPLHPVEISNSGQIKNVLELVPQPSYSGRMMPFSDPQASVVGNDLGLTQSGHEDMKNSEHFGSGSQPPSASRIITSHDISSQVPYGQTDPHHVRTNKDTLSRKVTFGDLVRDRDMDEPDDTAEQGDRSPLINWNFKDTSTVMDDPNSYPYLPPVLEEPSSSFSEAADDDPLPAVEGLQISGKAYPGEQLEACGHSVNGTTSCNFEWVRHSEDGSINYVEGANKPTYLVTADDVDMYLAIEVQPLDDRKRKGELVKVFANDHRKIPCDPQMLTSIEKTLYTGHASFKLSLSTGYLDIWEPATLAIKRDGYSIKCSGPNGGVAEKFSPSVIVSIPLGSLTEFSIIDSLGTEHMLRVDNWSTDISSSRDTIVLTLRLFILKARDRKKGKKKSLFFHM